jgi:hypothetical protein
MAETPVILVIDDASDLEHVQKAIEAQGLKHSVAIPGLRILKGMIEPERINELRTVPGVRSVEQEREIKLRPPKPPTL